MKRIPPAPAPERPIARARFQHYPIPRGTPILLREGTKILREDGTPYIVPTDYCIDLSYNSPAEDEYIFWNRQRVKKSNICVCQRIW
jgi:hypothetical protein